MIDFEYDITNIQPASYNPRYLSDQKKELLKTSIEKCGCLKPIIVNSNGTIMAGHQRTKSMLELGMSTAPAYIIDGIGKTDEVRFNQMHNGSDKEITNQDIVVISGELAEGWQFVEPKSIKLEKLGNGTACYKNELSRLISRYGAFGGSVCDLDGVVIVSPDYASVCHMLGIKLLVYRCKDQEQVDNVLTYFSFDYGVFCYDHLAKKTYIQTLAQMNRLEGGKQFKSRTYEDRVMPILRKVNGKDLRVLDFGAGKMAYVRKLKKLGYNIHGVEFFYRKENANSIDVAFVKSCVAIMVEDIKKNGLYDIIVCDSVLNSVDSIEAERSVIDTCYALCKKGGTVIMSGRTLLGAEKKGSSSRQTTNQNYIYFIDKNGFTANMRSGEWFYQKFHTKNEILGIIKRIGSGTPYGEDGRGSFQIVCNRGEKNLTIDEISDAIKFEFSLPLPVGRYDLSKEVLEAVCEYHE
jgi:ParB family chromosome partitioning protein